VKSITTNLAQNDYKLSSLILGIVNSVPFQQRRSTVNKGEIASNVRHP
jgi:hypothetical protein